MEFLTLILKILFVTATVLLVAVPFIAEYSSFKHDKENGISHKRLRLAVFSVVYAAAVTVALCILKELLLWIGSLSFVQWLAVRLAVGGRVSYFTEVLAVLLVNFAIGILFGILEHFVRIGLKNKNLLTPKKKNGEYTLLQRIERWIIKKVHTETGYFIGRILKWFNIILSVIYALLLVMYQLPAVFGAGWIPYDFISMLLGAGYIYPTITLWVLWETYFFFEGVRALDSECPDFVRGGAAQPAPTVDINSIDKACREMFGDYYACGVGDNKQHSIRLAAEHDPLTRYIAQSIENDARNPKTVKEVYLDCLDKLFEYDGSVLLHGEFFSEFSMYFLRYLSIILARGDNVVIVCNDDKQIGAAYDFVISGLSQISSLFCDGFGDKKLDYDNPIWKVVKISGEHDTIDEATVNESSVLITTLGYICSTDFEKKRGRFIHLIDTIVFVDVGGTLNGYARQLAILDSRLCHITQSNALLSQNSHKNGGFSVRYMSRPIRYICFDSTKTAGLDLALKNMLRTKFNTIDCINTDTEALVRCYNYDGTLDSDGRMRLTQMLNTDEEIGVVMSMALTAIGKGAPNVAVFAGGMLPHANTRETIASYAGQLPTDIDGRLTVNEYFYNPDNYSVIVAFDSNNNLPVAIRRYIGLTTDKPSLVIVVSRPYMLRDYYLAHIDEIWEGSQLLRVPSVESVESAGQGGRSERIQSKQAVAQRILVQANAGGISEEEILTLASRVAELRQYVDETTLGKGKTPRGDVNSILRAVLEPYGVDRTESVNLYDYFEYSAAKYFDENGIYRSHYNVTLRRQGSVFDIINGRDMAIMSVNGTEYVLTTPKNRLSQNYIAHQHLLYNGSIYYINDIDIEHGVINARLTPSGINNESYEYIQSRRYRLEFAGDGIDYLYPVRHIKQELRDGDVSVSDIIVSVLRVPMEVMTDGYYALDPHELDPTSKNVRYISISDSDNERLAWQTYRRYGDVKTKTCPSEGIMKESQLFAKANGALVMSVKVVGEFGAQTERVSALLGVMLGEILRSMFPSVADAVAVCPVYRGEPSWDDESKGILNRMPRLTVDGREAPAEGELEFLIIEDSNVELGVISALWADGGNIINTLFMPLMQYLDWYMSLDGSVKAEKRQYLHFGTGHEPQCFDFGAAHKLVRLLGDDKHNVSVIAPEPLVEYEVCDFCGKRYAKSSGIATLNDGRRICKSCAASLVGNNKKLLRAYLTQAKIYLESTYGITLGDDFDFCFESTVKIVNALKQNRDLSGRGSDAPLRSYIDKKTRTVHIECDIPAVGLRELLVRELTHTWQLTHIPDISEELAEGHIALVAVQYLRFLGQQSLAGVRTSYYESSTGISGEGYRKLVRELLKNPQYRNDPFRYLLELTGHGGEDITPPHPLPVITETGEYGLAYTPASPDRHTDGTMPYFYYSRLPESKQKAYDILLDAIRSHTVEVSVPGTSCEDIFNVLECIEFDHPELFWYRCAKAADGAAELGYGADAEECAVLQKRIDEAAAQYLAGIDDGMSAYDAAIRLHAKLIGTVDYDTVALDKEKKKGGPDRDKIDPLRSICGVFLDGKAVCEGYARAMQYLLQRCGIECAEVAGHTVGEGAHAWNIVKLDGDYYFLDVTWDDASSTVQAVKNTHMGYNYFCVTTAEMERTRKTDLCPADIPACTAVRANYYTHNGLVIDSYELAKIKGFAVEAAKRGDKVVTFKCTDKKLFDEVREQLFVIGSDGFDVVKAAAKADKTIDPSAYTHSGDDNIYTVTIYFKTK